MGRILRIDVEFVNVELDKINIEAPRRFF